jgi:hypothetical protein
MQDLNTQSANSDRTPIKLYAGIWLLSVLPAFLLRSPDNFLGYFLSMIVHELGHCLASISAGIPAVAFFFASFSLSSTPSIPLVLGLLAVEGFCIRICFRKGALGSLTILVILALVHNFFLFNPDLSERFSILGGIGGEFVIPLVAFIIMSEFVPYPRPRSMIILGISCFVFWRSLIAWSLAATKLGPIPYPRDSTGSVALFQDPFLAGTGAPVGDIDKLLSLYGWTEPGIASMYLGLGLICLSGFIAAILIQVIRR